MKTHGYQIAVLAVLIATFASAATVDNLTVRQRWPWGPQVDVDFTLSGTDAIGFTYEVTYDGASGWTSLDESALSGDIRSVAPGDHHLTWNPSASGLGNQTLKNLQFRVLPYTFNDRKYLVVDIRNKTYEYMSEPPAGGWSAEGGYMSSKMAFRRIPAGTYTLGHPDADISPYKSDSGFMSHLQKVMGTREVTISSDYYMAVYPLTVGQRYFIRNYTDHAEQSVYASANYENTRGTKNWPVDKFAVDDNSEVGLFRKRYNGELLIDLPSAAQYEVAMRAGTTTIFPNGGTGADAPADAKANYYLKLSPEQAENVGLRDPNGWGIYNPIGMHWYLLLDAASALQDVVTVSGKEFLEHAESGVDPIGRTVTDAADRRRTRMGGGWYQATFICMSGYRAAATETTNGALRFCIHLNASIAD